MLNHIPTFRDSILLSFSRGQTVQEEWLLTLEDGTDMLIKIQLDATVCRYLFTAKSLYMFRVSPHASSGVLKTVTVASGRSHNIGTDTSLQRGQIGNYDARNHELKMGPICCLETSVSKYQTTPSNMREEKKSKKKQILDNFCSIDLHMTMLRGGGGVRGAGAGGEVEKYKSFWIQFEVNDSKFLAWKSGPHLTIEDHALFPYLVAASHKTHCVLVTKASHLILFREINIYIFCESYNPLQLSCG